MTINNKSTNFFVVVKKQLIWYLIYLKTLIGCPFSAQNCYDMYIKEIGFER